MDSIVAVAVRLDTGLQRFYLTFGRIFDPVDSVELEKVVLIYAKLSKIDGKPVNAEVAYSLLDAAREPYFYEAYFLIINTYNELLDLHGDNLMSVLQTDLRKGKYIFYCGSRAQREKCRTNFWSMQLE